MLDKLGLPCSENIQDMGHGVPKHQRCFKKGCSVYTSSFVTVMTSLVERSRRTALESKPKLSRLTNTMSSSAAVRWAAWNKATRLGRRASGEGTSGRRQKSPAVESDFASESLQHAVAAALVQPRRLGQRSELGAALHFGLSGDEAHEREERE